MLELHGRPLECSRLLDVVAGGGPPCPLDCPPAQVTTPTSPPIRPILLTPSHPPLRCGSGLGAGIAAARAGLGPAPAGAVECAAAELRRQRRQFERSVAAGESGGSGAGRGRRPDEGRAPRATPGRWAAPRHRGRVCRVGLRLARALSALTKRAARRRGGGRIARTARGGGGGRGARAMLRQGIGRRGAPTAGQRLQPTPLPDHLVRRYRHASLPRR